MNILRVRKDVMLYSVCVCRGTWIYCGYVKMLCCVVCV
jgi:hypothetical protein